MHTQVSSLNSDIQTLAVYVMFKHAKHCRAVFKLVVEHKNVVNASNEFSIGLNCFIGET